MEDKIIIMVRDETLIQSIISDAITLFMISACVYISGDSTFWQVVCLGMFLIYLTGKASVIKLHKFKNMEEVKEWAKGI